MQYQRLAEAGSVSVFQSVRVFCKESAGFFASKIQKLRILLYKDVCAMQSQMKSYSNFGPGQTAGQFRLRQGGAPFHLSPSFCRGRTHGRLRAHARTLPKVSRPPREAASHPLLSGHAVIVLNDFYNGDGPARSIAPGP